MLNITEGVWRSYMVGGGYRLQVHEGVPLLDGSTAEANDNGILMADAGNTYQKCDLMPSELLKQRNELISALKLARDCFDGFLDMLLWNSQYHPLLYPTIRERMKETKEVKQIDQMLIELEKFGVPFSIGKKKKWYTKDRDIDKIPSATYTEIRESDEPNARILAKVAATHTDHGQEVLKLIMEAPEMLEVLEKLVDAWSSNMNVFENSNYEALLLQAKQCIANASHERKEVSCD